MLLGPSAERADLQAVLAERAARAIIVVNFQVERRRMAARIAQIARHENAIALVFEAAVDHLYRLHAGQEDEHDGGESDRSQHDEKRTFAHGRRARATINMNAAGAARVRLSC